jgi:hypothetical protein
MDVGSPSNFERMSWLYDNDLDAMRRDIFGVRYTDDEVRETIRRVYETRGYLLDPHSAIGYLGLKGLERQELRNGRIGRMGERESSSRPRIRRSSRRSSSRSSAARSRGRSRSPMRCRGRAAF